MIEITSDNDLFTILKDNELVIVLFYANWCNPCRKMKKILKSIHDEFKMIRIITIDIERDSNLFLDNDINVIPMVHYYKKGHVFSKESGLKSSEYLRMNIEALIKIPLN
ncbi:hypothetical protein SY27_07350 [Flavobacterium sp. 316]|uniref:thioredoxin family protein n=1 Tax=Flavobacterium sp. 316 TaxID=1603293 RepID=UPI0005E3FE74|nr:thioredoxin family protein [Flavobacterium sp. 316]KIX21510.1 hypothetical protein SY27_07350 [Flavobacterium sp. 316]